MQCGGALDTEALTCRDCLEHNAADELQAWFARWRMSPVRLNALGGSCMAIELHTMAAGVESREAFIKAAGEAWDDTAPFAVEIRKLIALSKGN